MMLRVGLINTALTFLFQLEMMMELTKVDRAIVFATQKHAGQYRKSMGIPYICHPLEVLKQIKVWWIDNEMVDCAAVLHDTVEDTNTTIQEIENEFGLGVATLVDDLTFRPGYRTKDEYLAGFKDKPWHSHLIKIADRLCNVRDFILTDRAYALKYLLKAEKLINDFGRRDDVVNALKNSIQDDTTSLLGYLQYGN